MAGLLVHATHEAGVKVGGIGAVLDGLLASKAYNDAVERTILLGGYSGLDSVEQERLRAPRNRLTIRYHTRDGIMDVPESLALAFHTVQQQHGVSILYGTRKFGDAEHEVLLVDSGGARRDAADDLKAFLYAQYGIHSDRYESEPEFHQHIEGAVPQVHALGALLQSQVEQAYFIAHEWLGLPALFAAERHLPGQFKRIFYAHEVATVRALVEAHPGHDLRFYNAMRFAGYMGLSLEKVFGNQSHFFKHALLRAALYLDGVFAVGDLVKEELEFLEPALRNRRIDLVYNGVPSARLTVEEKARSKQLLRQYARALHGFEPAWVFSHVTRLIPSKGIWRDFRVMESLDQHLADRGETAILFLLSSVQPTGRRSEDVHRWEREYGWPVHHRADTGDLVAYEWDYYQMTERFNWSARASRVVFVNQFGWSRDRCGTRMPEEMEFMDLRHGADVEFGQSIYEPFGIAQVEPLSFGALCVLSNACGCVGFIRDVGGSDAPNVIVGDYLYLPEWAGYNDLSRIMNIGRSERDSIEALVAQQVAGQIIERLPRTAADLEARLERGYEIGARMSWDVVARDYLMPAINHIGL
jgi:glycosyltransferase involved in cell wall biosynthesis